MNRNHPGSAEARSAVINASLRRNSSQEWTEPGTTADEWVMCLHSFCALTCSFLRAAGPAGTTQDLKTACDVAVGLAYSLHNATWQLLEELTRPEDKAHLPGGQPWWTSPAGAVAADAAVAVKSLSRLPVEFEEEYDLAETMEGSFAVHVLFTKLGPALDDPEVQKFLVTRHLTPEYREVLDRIYALATGALPPEDFR